MKLSLEEEQLLISLIRRVGKVMSYELFREVANKFVLTPVEAVILRKKDGKIQMLLTPRNPSDPDWAGKVHVPGTILRFSDFDEKAGYLKALKRIEENEIKKRFSQKPILVGAWFYKVKRGVENAMIFVCRVKGVPKVGKFYDVDKLPKNIVQSQIGFIRFAVKEAQKRKLLD